MPVKVFIEPFENRYRAICRMFDFEVVADTKAEASEKMNDKIRRHVEELSRSGQIPVRENATSCEKEASCPVKGCSGCSSSG